MTSAAREGTWQESRFVGTLSVAALLAGMSLAVWGCSQSGPAKSDETAKSSPPDESPEPDEQKMADEPIVDPEVKPTRAESPIRASEESTPPDEPADPDAPAKLPPAQPAMAPLPLDDVETADLTMPAVKLTEHHAAMCLVKVGDSFPEMSLPTPAGEEQSLAELFGEKLTLVVFWNGTEPTALEQLADLARYHQPRFGDQGLAIVAIDTGDSTQLAGELAKQAGAAFPVLVDSDGSAFARVATAKLPRSYLLNSDGQVLWFDLEYSATTRRDMVQAIRYSLAH